MSKDAPGNTPEFSVSELSQALKMTVEGTFSHVRVRAEISGFLAARSGHLYMSLKDDKAVIDGVMWKGGAAGLSFRPEDGLEVVCTGRLSTYPARSKYQLVIEKMEPAGAGALMAMLEERRKKLAAEGLFDEVRKKPIPYIPNVIGVVTSPTGAVIRDILHRLADRFPRHVILWPVQVQGEGAAEQVAAAVRGFDAMEIGGNIPRPDVLIVARGGGSLEDLWAFNEENVVRAVAECSIPVISAVGHETDTTLIDYAADRRAPTPTGAAEMVVPVLRDLQYNLDELGMRLPRAVTRGITRSADEIRALVRSLPRPRDILGLKQQRSDDLSERLPRALMGLTARFQTRLVSVSARLQPGMLRAGVSRGGERVDSLASRLGRAITTNVSERRAGLDSAARLLPALSYQGVLKRGFAVVFGENGKPVTTTHAVSAGAALNIELQDGRFDAIAGANNVAAPTKPNPTRKKKKPSGDDGQGSLL